LSIVKCLHQQGAIALLQVLHARLEREGWPSNSLSMWIFALLARIERALPSEQAAVLRALLRTCTRLRAQCGCNLPLVSAARIAEGDSDPYNVAGLNTLICIMGMYFGQASDAEIHTGIRSHEMH